MTAISGNTYPVKDAIKALGGRWNPDQKVWMVPDTQADEARRLVAGAAVAAPARPSRSHRHYGQCICTEHGCCRPRCHCDTGCVCRGGNRFDCLG